MSDDHVRARFGERAEYYVTSPTHASGADLETLVDWADPRAGEVAVDVATGGGHVALGLARRGATVTAVDLTPEMLAVAREHLEREGAAATYVVAHAAALPFDSSTADIVTCRIAAHHFRDAGAFFREAYRVLLSGGRLAFQDQSLPETVTSACIVDEFERLRDPSHRHAYSASGWRTLAERAGFVIERTQLFEKRHDFGDWCAAQSCSPQTIARLEDLVSSAPPQAQDWMAPVWVEGHLESFSNRHLVLIARKPADS